MLRYDPAELLKIRVPDFQITARLDLRESGKQLSGTTNFACMYRCQKRLVLFGTTTTFLGPATIHMKVEPEFVMLVDPATLDALRVMPIAGCWPLPLVDQDTLGERRKRIYPSRNSSSPVAELAQSFGGQPKALAASATVGMNSSAARLTHPFSKTNHAAKCPKHPPEPRPHGSRRW